MQKRTKKPEKERNRKKRRKKTLRKPARIASRKMAELEAGEWLAAPDFGSSYSPRSAANCGRFAQGTPELGRPIAAEQKRAIGQKNAQKKSRCKN